MEEMLNSAMNQNFIPVVDDLGNFNGIVTRKDIIRYFAEQKTPSCLNCCRKSYEPYHITAGEPPM